jgi:DNA-directed RNA polymerase specialized sigma24 family protein
VPLADVLEGVTQAVGDEAGRRQEHLERLLVDKRVRDGLAPNDFSGHRYARFEEELVRYGISVLRGWMYTGYVFRLAANRGFGLKPSESELAELQRDSDVREELAAMTVAIALPRFRQKALIEGGWQPEGGASLATYFMGACMYVFPNEFRKHRVQRTRWQLEDDTDAVVNAPAPDHWSDPAAISVGTLCVREDLDRLDPRTRAVIALTLDDHSQVEIAEILGMTVRGVEGVLYRWRTKEQARIHRRGGD